MSSGSHKSDLAILATLGGVTVLVILVSVVWGPLSDKSKSGAVVRTTHSTNTEGVKAYYVLLERLGFPVDRSVRPLESESLRASSVLVLLDPLIQLRNDELFALRRWVTRGGVLVFTTRCAGAMRFWDPDVVPPWPKRVGDPRQETTRKGSPSSTPTTVNVEKSLLGTEVGEAEFASPMTLDVQYDELGETTHTEVLYADRVGPRIAARALEKGWLILLADSSFLSNGRIGRAGNSVLAANLAAYARWRGGGGPVLFDEYHLGFGARESGWQVMGFLLLHTSPGWGVLVATVAGMLWLLYKGRKFGTRRGVKRTRRRSKLEYVYSVGATYRSAGAERIVLEQILRWFRRRACESIGASPNVSDHELARQLSRRSGHSPAHYERALLQCEEAIARPHVRARHLSEMLNRLAALESETLDAHPRGQ